MHALLIYNQHNAKWNLFDPKQNKVLFRGFDRTKVEQWGSANGFRTFERR